MSPVGSGLKTSEYVSGRDNNHLHPPTDRTSAKVEGVTPRSGHNQTENDKDKSSGEHDKQYDTGFASQPPSCRTVASNRRSSGLGSSRWPSEGCVQTATECTANSYTADERSELVPGYSMVLFRGGRTPVGMRAVPLTRRMLPAAPELADAEGGARAGSVDR